MASVPFLSRFVATQSFKVDDGRKQGGYKDKRFWGPLAPPLPRAAPPPLPNRSEGERGRRFGGGRGLGGGRSLARAAEKELFGCFLGRWGARVERRARKRLSQGTENGVAFLVCVCFASKGGKGKGGVRARARVRCARAARKSRGRRQLCEKRGPPTEALPCSLPNGSHARHAQRRNKSKRGVGVGGARAKKNGRPLAATRGGGRERTEAPPPPRTPAASSVALPFLRLKTRAASGGWRRGGCPRM